MKINHHRVRVDFGGRSQSGTKLFEQKYEFKYLPNCNHIQINTAWEREG